jgi:oligopeptide transport system substrate-binding protein
VRRAAAGPGRGDGQRGEPQNPLIPTNTNENNGGRIIDRLFAGLMSYDAHGNPTNEVARSIDTTDNVNFHITLQPDWKFTDGTPVTAKSFVDAWNYGALSTNGQLQQSFFSPIVGFDEVAGEKPTAQTMSGLAVLNDTEFTVRPQGADHRFHPAAGVHPVLSATAGAFADMAAFGRHPVGNGPYGWPAATPGSNVRIDLVPNADYHGNRPARNKGLRMVFYANLDTAYADLLAGNLDVLDTVPTSALPTFRKDLGDRAMTGPVAQNQTLDTPLRLDHFGGEEGWPAPALSAAINRPQICEQIFSGSRSPARDFTASSLPGFSADLAGNDALDYNPDRARALWAKADAISRWSGQYVIAYNADGGHQEWVDAVANSLKNTLGIDAVGAPQPTFAAMRTQITDRTIGTAFRAGWQGDYPSMLEFLEPLFVTGAGSNDVDYSNREFDGAVTAAQAAPTLPSRRR